MRIWHNNWQTRLQQLFLFRFSWTTKKTSEPKIRGREPRHPTHHSLCLARGCDPGNL